MTIRNILVNLDLDSVSSSLIKCAADLAFRFDAGLIGFTAAQPSLGLVVADGAVVTEQFYLEERGAIEQKIRAAEEAFRSTVPLGIEVNWRGYLQYPTQGVIDLAARADLVLFGSRSGVKPDYMRLADAGDVVLGAGRPVLIAGEGVTAIAAKKVVVAWKDTREARRAVSDALPFLKLADQVLAVTVAEGDFGVALAELDELTLWLKSHGVRVQAKTLPRTGAVMAAVRQASVEFGADLIVSGGYGHHRVREWLFGGVTQDLLKEGTLNRLISN
jgi:nucleotide-binding universal stress UspA family protein